MFKRLLIAALAAAPLLLAGAPVEAGQTLDAIRARGTFKCGVGTGSPGFGFPDDKGVWQGFNAVVCRALAISIFGDPEKTQMIQLTAQQRFTALQLGEVDAIAGNTTLTLLRDTQLGFNFGPVVFYDGQGLLVSKKLGVKSAKELNGATVCIQPGTTSELNLTDFFRRNKISFTPLVIESVAEVRNAFFNGRCDVYSSDASLLAAARAGSKNPEDYVLMPELLSKEPIAPLIRHGDDQWLDIVRWTIYAMIEAEELGIDSKNVDQMLTSSDPAVRRLLGVDPGMGEALGVDAKFAYNIIKKIGNYGENYEKWLGPNTALKLDRGMNNLWTKGGLLYSPPFR